MTAPTALLQGHSVTADDAQALKSALNEAFGYRGDVTISTKDGRRIDGYVFDIREGESLESSWVRVLTATSEDRLVVKYSDIESLAFSGRDTAAGKSWETWLRRYAAKRASGEAASIESDSGEQDSAASSG
ncbi:MAG: hypothetical protein EXS17_05755 [Phycisphaerales bacterium]|nr:hypothetical protein [Phycisphaerales bacterium]